MVIVTMYVCMCVSGFYLKQCYSPTVSIIDMNEAFMLFSQDI